MEAVSKGKERVAKASPTGFSGNLAIVPIMDVLEKVRNQGETGLLSVWTPMVKGTVWVCKGETVDAEVGVRRGLAALDLLGLLGDGSFAFEGRESVDRESAIQMPSSEVLARWRSAEDRWRAQLNKLPSLLDQVHWDAKADPAAVADSEASRAVLGRLRQGCTLLEVLVEVEQDIDVALGALVAASASFDKRGAAPADNTQPHNDRESPRPVWTAPPPAGRAKPAHADAFVGTLGGHLTSTNPKRRFLVTSAAPAAPRDVPELEATPATTPAAARTPTTAQAKLGARTLLGVPMGDVLEARGPAPTREPLDGILGEMIEPAPETIRTSSPPPGERANPKPLSASPTTTMLAGSLPVAAPAAEATATPQPRVIPRAQWDGRRHVGGSLEVGGRKLEKVRTLSTGRFVCELVEETQGAQALEWALKMPARALPDVFAALQNEIRHLSQCRHHAVVEYGASGTDVDVPYLLTRYHPGLTLSEIAEKQGKLPFGIMAGIGKQVLQGLVYLHDSARPQGALVHSDVCPDNVLIGFDGVVKITGFSSVRRMSEGHIEGDVRAQARYSSPELLRGETFDGRADVFSVGALLRFLAGPEEGKHKPEVERLIARALEADLNTRYPNAAQMLLELTDVPGVATVQEIADWMSQTGLVDGGANAAGPGMARAEGEHDAKERSGRRRPLLIIIGLVVAIAVVALLLFWMKG